MKTANFDNVIGHIEQKNYINQCLESNSLKHFYIFLGEEHLGKSNLAITLAKNLLCDTDSRTPCETCNNCLLIDKLRHPDLILITKEADKKNISIDQVRKLKDLIKYRPYYSNKRIVLLKNAYNLSNEAFNALLKTLEEPDQKNVIILTINSISQLPDTIISRAQIIKFKKVKSTEIYSFETNI